MEWLIPVLIATVFGFLAGMGIGGGSLLLLWLTQVVGMSQPQARILNLLFFIPAALVASVFGRKKQPPLRSTVIPAASTGCLFAAMFSVLSQSWDISLMRRLLGGLLILTGLREVFYRPRNAK